MSIRIELHLIHPFFTEPFQVNIDWSFPFLPRVGEGINPWIWIEQNKVKKSDIKPLLTDEALESLKENTYTLEDWLYEVGIECNCIQSVTYFKEKPEGIFVMMFLEERGLTNRL